MASKSMFASEQSLTGTGTYSRSAILAVGDPDEWKHQGNALPTEGMAFLTLADINAVTLAEHAPEIIYSPALARGFDCIELAQLLHNLGYEGAYRAIAKDLPKPELIEREVKQMCPRLDFSVIVVS